MPRIIATVHPHGPSSPSPIVRSEEIRAALSWGDVRMLGGKCIADAIVRAVQANFDPRSKDFCILVRFTEKADAAKN